MAEFRTEFLASLTELESASKKGIEEINQQLEERAKTAEKAAGEAKAAAEKAANDAKTAAKAASDATRPGFLNITVTGDFDDEVVISIADVEVARSRGKTLAIERIPAGPTTMTAVAKKGARQLETSQIVDVKPGIQEVRINLG